MKKKIIFFAAAALFAVCACDNKKDVAPVQAEGQTEFITFGVTSPLNAEITTKASGQPTHTADEAKVNKLQVFVFNPDGSLNGFGSATGESCQVQVTRGTDMRCYAVVNYAPVLSDISDEGYLKAKASLLLDNTASSFHMFGMKTLDVSTGNTFTIPVKRLASKVTLGTVSKSMTSAALDGKSFNVKGVYLINACAYTTFNNQSLTGERWLNKRVYDATENTNGFLGGKTYNTAVTSEGVAFNANMYCYPNSVLAANDNSAKGDFTPRMTRLVIEVEIGDVTYFYPINIHSKDNGLLANKHYIVSKVVISGPGSKDPDILPEISNISFSVEVADWDTEELDEIRF